MHTRTVRSCFTTTESPLVCARLFENDLFKMRVILSLLLFGCLFAPGCYAMWFLPKLGLSSTEANDQLSFPCERIPGLGRYQRQMCRMHPDVMPAVSDGIKLAIAECQHQFRSERWNCTTRNEEGFENIILKIGSREEAFAYAITSAGIVHRIAKLCGEGRIVGCTCNGAFEPSLGGRDTEGEFLWGGCSVNFRYANNFTRRFLDRRTRRHQDPQEMMHLQNSKAGRKAVGTHLRTKCKCHGVSGSCVTRTCWKELADFRDVGVFLHQQYRGAIQVSMMKSSEGKRLESFSAQLVSRMHDSVAKGSDGDKAKVRKIRKTDLVYFESSPDYCAKDLNLGSMGTDGRTCNASSTGRDSCDSMCCGRGYVSTTESRTYRCNCRFVWCCSVKCETCQDVVTLQRCRAEGSVRDAAAREQFVRSSRDHPLQPAAMFEQFRNFHLKDAFRLN